MSKDTGFYNGNEELEDEDETVAEGLFDDMDDEEVDESEFDDEEIDEFKGAPTEEEMLKMLGLDSDDELLENLILALGEEEAAEDEETQNEYCLRSFGLTEEQTNELLESFMDDYHPIIMAGIELMAQLAHVEAENHDKEGTRNKELFVRWLGNHLVNTLAQSEPMAYEIESMFR